MGQGNAVSGAALAALLDLHEGISDPPALSAVELLRARRAVGTLAAPVERHADPSAASCRRWPEGLRLVSSQGELVRGRCRSTNLCAYCARLAAVENAELLALDAMSGQAPELYAVLTTAQAIKEPAPFYRAREAVIRALKRRWPAVEYAALVEFTTGRAGTSGGERRPHWNLLLKGIPASAREDAAMVIRRVWCGRRDVEAVPDAQYVGEVAHVGGLMRYLALHFQKVEQAPPEGWRGHRFLKSHGYLGRPTVEAREEAKAALRFKRELWRAIRTGADAPTAEAMATAAVELADATSWRLIQHEDGHELAGARSAVGRDAWVDDARLVRVVVRVPPTPPVGIGGHEKLRALGRFAVELRDELVARPPDPYRVSSEGRAEETAPGPYIDLHQRQLKFAAAAYPIRGS